MDDSKRTFVPNPDVAFRDIAGALVIVHPTANRLLELNETGSAIWRLLDGRSVREISERIALEFDVELSRAETDVVEFLSYLAERGLVQEGQ